MGILYIVISLFILYSVLIIYYWSGWRSVPLFSVEGEGLPMPLTKISVIIPARNEEDNIGKLLTALQDQTYPRELFEVIVIDDHSSDRTAEIAKQFKNVKLIALKEEGINSYKKKAIETGIHTAAGEIIVTTDADCIPKPGWLQTIAAFKEKNNSVFIAAPVAINCNPSLLQAFQAMDFMVLQGITASSVYKNVHSMCNGANIAYERKAFHEINGFENIDHIASGDDMLLMHKIRKKYPDRLHYLQSQAAIVETLPMKTWKDFFNQRIRWASKAAVYDDKRITWVLLLVYLFNLSFLLLLVAGFWNYYFWLYMLILWALKTLVELPLFYSVAQFFGKQWAVKLFFFFQPLHVAYTIAAGLLGQFRKYEWKGRRVS